MPKAPEQPTTKKLPRKRPNDPVALDVQVKPEVTNQAIGDTADEITRAPKKDG